jgi:polyisoprenoid-binding protein YceI
MEQSMTSATALPGWVAGTWTIDPAHSRVGFSVRHLMSKVRGTFGEFSGEIVTEEDPTQSTVTAVIEMSSVDTGVEMRDNHLRSGDFFGVEENPRMTFSSTTLRHDGERWVLTGDLTIRDITKAVELELDYLGVDPTGLEGEHRIGFEARTTISRKEFGVNWGLVTEGTKIMVGDRIDVTLDVQAALVGDKADN